MKIYFPVLHDYENSAYGPFFLSRENAEATAKMLGEEYIVEEQTVLVQIPRRVTMYWASRTHKSPDDIRTGSDEWWDYEVESLPREGYTAWAKTEEEARAALGEAVAK